MNSVRGAGKGSVSAMALVLALAPGAWALSDTSGPGAGHRSVATVLADSNWTSAPTGQANPDDSNWT